MSSINLYINEEKPKLYGFIFIFKMCCRKLYMNMIHSICLHVKFVNLLYNKYQLLHLKVVFKLCLIQIRKKVICSVALLKWQKIPELQQGLKLFIKLNKYPWFRCSTLLLKIIIYTNFNYCC